MYNRKYCNMRNSSERALDNRTKESVKKLEAVMTDYIASEMGLILSNIERGDFDAALENSETMDYNVRDLMQQIHRTLVLRKVRQDEFDEIRKALYGR